VLETSIRNLVEQFVREYKKRDVEAWVLSRFAKEIPAIGGGYARNIETTGLIYYTAFSGIYKDKKLPYLRKENRIVNYAINNRTIVVINDIHHLPPGTEFKGKVEEGTKYMIVPITPDKDLIGDTPKVHGIVLLERQGEDFTDQDLRRAEKIKKETSVVIDSYMNATHFRKLKKLALSGKELIMRSINSDISKYELAKEYISLAIELIDAAEKGSALIETERGMKFIAVVGYDENILLNLPPLPTERSKDIWYMLGKEALEKGIPRIISEREIEQILSDDLIAETLPDTQNMKANLMIPINLRNGKLLEVNLDNFSGDEPFDDMDIEIASTLSTYLTASYELITRREEAERNNSMIRQLRFLIDTTIPKASGKDISNMHKVFLGSVINSLRVLNLHGILSTSPRRNFTVNVLCSREELPAFIKDIVGEMAKIMYETDKEDAIKSVYPYDIFFLKRTLETDKEDITFVIALVKHRDIWTETDIHFVYNTIDISILMAQNVIFLNAMSATQEDTLRLLGKALEMRDLETKGHTERTAYMTSVFADAVGFPDKRGIMWGAYVHDIGKIAIPDYILLKPGRLTKEEFEIMKKHVWYGYELISGIKGIPEATRNVVLYHHEKWDGTGYLKGLKGEDIPLEARIFAIIDVFDALISKRPYKEAWPIEKAITIIRENSGSHFDPKLVDIFLHLVKDTDLIEKLQTITQIAMEK